MAGAAGKKRRLSESTEGDRGPAQKAKLTAGGSAVASSLGNATKESKELSEKRAPGNKRRRSPEGDRAGPKKVKLTAGGSAVASSLGNAIDANEESQELTEERAPGNKRRRSPQGDRRGSKKVKLTAGGSEGVSSPSNATDTTKESQEPLKRSSKSKGKEKAVSLDEDVAMPTEEEDSKPSSNSKHRVRKLAPPRPFPTVPTSVSATGPRSAHTEGKNVICITRKTPLGAYLRRCKDVILKDGYKTLHLSAMGAAIPHLLQLSMSLPSILPHASEEIHTEVLTGTVQVQDELVPEDDDEDLSYRTRDKSSLMVTIKIGDGVDEVLRSGKGKKGQKSTNSKGKQSSSNRQKEKGEGSSKQGTKQIVVREEDMDEE